LGRKKSDSGPQVDRATVMLDRRLPPPSVPIRFDLNTIVGPVCDVDAVADAQG